MRAAAVCGYAPIVVMGELDDIVPDFVSAIDDGHGAAVAAAFRAAKAEMEAQ